MSSARPRMHAPWLDTRPGRARGPAQPPPAESDTGTRSRPAHPAHPVEEAPPRWIGMAWTALGLTALFGLVAAIGGNGEAAAALYTGPFLLGVTWLIGRRIATIDHRPAIAPILTAAFGLKIIGSLLRYHVSANVYGTGDAFDYDRRGRIVAAGLREGHLVSFPGRFAGTNFMRTMTGFLYLVTPAKLLSGYIVYSWLAFIGLVFFWRAYRTAVPQHDDLRYLKWVVLLPSLLYWPSAVGKDAFMVLCCGVASYGVACLFSERLVPGLLAVSLGLLGMCMVRPHVALCVCAGLLVATLIRRHRGGIGHALISAAFVVGAGMLVMQTTSSFFSMEVFNRSSVQTQITDVQAQTSEGGSSFNPIPVTNPVLFPPATFTVFFRPLPIEAHSFQEFLTAVEDVVLLFITIRAVPRIGRALRAGRDQPYFIYCFIALLVFVFAFSGISNFGILARQRSVVQALLLALITLPASAPVPGARGVRGSPGARGVRGVRGGPAARGAPQGALGARGAFGARGAPRANPAAGWLRR
jgi:hypothetical protein